MVIFQNVFSRYLVAFFELDLHIWCLGSYLKMFPGKIKVFMKKYFFESWGRLWIEISTIWMVYCLEISSKFDQNVRKFHRKNIFSPKILFSLKTYSDSSLNTEYEPLTPKTERISSNFHPKIMKNDYFQWKNSQIWAFLRYQDFEVKK